VLFLLGTLTAYNLPVYNRSAIVEKIEIVKATQNNNIVIARLLELYVYDFTEYMDFDVDEEGLFHYPFEEYLSLPDHFIYLILVNGHYAGLVLMKLATNEQGKSYYTIAEFFILKKYRKLGIGKKVASKILMDYPGHWMIYQSKNNIPAQIFWRKIIAECTNGQYKEYQKDDKPHQEFDIII
jgi:predicted acetyltransferase